jgi:predicted enzyme related to lactoylglutathione lyase
VGIKGGGRPLYDFSMQFGATVLYVDDVAEVVEFYRRAFGLELRFYDEVLGFAELETGSTTLAIASHSLGEMLMPGAYSRPSDGRPAGVEIAFLTTDVSASFAKAVAEGASPITPPRTMPWGLEVAYVRAPEGTVIGFTEPPPKTVAG